MRTISFILAFYILLCSAVPCCADDCTASAKTEKKGGTCKGDCSPFFTCGNCCGFSINIEQITITPIVVFKKTRYSEFNIAGNAGYFFSFWQPPRLG